jgi:hypothetical protein
MASKFNLAIYVNLIIIKIIIITWQLKAFEAHNPPIVAIVAIVVVDIT